MGKPSASGAWGEGVGLALALFPTPPHPLGPVQFLMSDLHIAHAHNYRWIGHCTMTLVSAHSLGFWVLWLLQGKWLQEALDMGSRWVSGGEGRREVRPRMRGQILS